MAKEIVIHTIGATLDASTSNMEQEALVALMDKGKDVGIDLSGCNYVSSAGLRVLLYSYKLARSKGLQLYLIGVHEEVREVMRMTGFEKFFEYYDTVEACMHQS